MTSLVLAGGFLGAGKTRLLLRAAELLRERGVRAALLTNDQGEELVDTRLAEASGFAAAEVAGGCFCCRFSQFLASAERLAAAGAQVILAEPVGSCADISATILQPLKSGYGANFRLAPFTVLVDPARARQLLAAEADPEAAFLFRNQLLEADIVAFTKADLGVEPPELPGIPSRRLSAATGAGVAAWLDEVLGGGIPAGSRLLEMDYERYARAEASLAWLNWRAEVRLRKPLTPAALAGPLLDAIDGALTAGGARIAHLKVFAQAATGHVKASVCANGEPPAVEGALDAFPAAVHTLVLNLRASGSPELLAEACARAAATLPGRTTVRHSEVFRPAPPRPERRATAIVPYHGPLPPVSPPKGG